MDADRRTVLLELSGACTAALIAGTSAALSSTLKVTGVVLVTVCASALGFSATRLFTKPDYRPLTAAIATIMIAGIVLSGFLLRKDQPTLGRLYDPEKLAVATPVNQNAPYAVDKPPPAQEPGSAPFVTVQPSKILNRGQPVTVVLNGTGFTSYSLVTADLAEPDGSGPETGSGNWADENGNVEIRLQWFPQTSLGTHGNDGAWPITVKDRASGRETVEQLTVRSDDSTPDSGEWPSYPGRDRRASGAPDVSAAVAGYLCTPSHAVSIINVQNLSPGGGVQIIVLNGDERKVAELDDTADDLGSVHAQPLFWDTANCQAGLEFEYKVLVIDGRTGQQAVGTLFFGVAP